MADLILGPVLRYVGETEATVWVETDAPCTVEVLGREEPTFTVEEHHYALVRIEGLDPAGFYEYEVKLDGERRWPEAGSEMPPSVIRTIDHGEPTDVCFGSCRVALPHDGKFVETKDKHSEGKEYDALRVLAREMIRGEHSEWPEYLFLLGDQVYVDEGALETRRKICERRGTDTPPGEEVTDYEEYSWLYEEAWSDPIIRWLLSTVSTSMVWDDHDMSDDWNISASWLEEIRRKAWWHKRAVSGVMSYWVYQHIGNLSPQALDEDDLYRRVRGNVHATTELREFAADIQTTGAGTRWSFCRDIDGTRVIFIDSRAGRVLEPGKRQIVDDEEWEWVLEHAEGDFDHVIFASTVPLLLSPGFHHLEAWSERVADGAWGGPMARLAERFRRSVDFDHWASFNRSFQAMRELLEELASGRRGRAPASITVISGDVHHAYLVEVGLQNGGAKAESSVYQAVCSPYRNPLDNKERRVIRIGFSRPFKAAMEALSRAAGAQAPGMSWRLTDGPFFDNQVATIRFDGREAKIKLDKTIEGEDAQRELDCVFERRLS